ncbi:MAG TPA: hypothetical protein VJ865_03535 [Gemmatimonadaceae bacterium]|nr:hypothetical protein [Gemmatimonadaceae bacterium]
MTRSKDIAMNMIKVIVLSLVSVVVANQASARQVPAGLSDRPVSNRVIAAVAQSPLQLVDALKDEGITVGLHIHEARFRSLRVVAGASLPARAAKTTTTVAQALAAFRANHPGWSAETTEAGVVLRDIGIQPRQDVVRDFSVTNIDVASAFAAAERAINPAIPVRSGTARSMISDPDRGQTIPPAPTLVSVALFNVSFEEILGAIAAQAPGTAWVLVRHESKERTYDSLSVRYPEGLHAESEWPLSVPLKR